MGLDRRLTNVLTAFRLYLDQTSGAVSQTFGNSSAEFEAIKKFKHSLYDNCFGYRLLEALRNYVQHCGLPIQIITFSSSRVESKDGYNIQFSISPKITFEDLESSEKLKKVILDEIKTRGGTIDIRLPVREYISCLVRLHNELRKTFANVLNNARSLYSEAVKEYSFIGGLPVQFPRLQCADESGVVNDHIALITDFLDIYDTLHKRNSNVTDITKSFASNAL